MRWHQLTRWWHSHKNSEVRLQELKLSHAMMGTHIRSLIDVESNPEHYARTLLPQGSCPWQPTVRLSCINETQCLIVSSYTCSSILRQKSNETDFLLTMNFILFTNQGYPLQNSSLGQLHSDGGIVSIVRSSVGRLPLVYLSACWLRSSGYYPKYQNGALSSGF